MEKTKRRLLNADFYNISEVFTFRESMNVESRDFFFFISNLFRK